MTQFEITTAHKIEIFNLIKIWNTKNLEYAFIQIIIQFSYQNFFQPR